MKLAGRSTDGTRMRKLQEAGRPATAGDCFDSVDRAAPTLTPRSATATIKNPAGTRVLSGGAESSAVVDEPEVRNREGRRRTGDTVCES